MVSAQNRTRYYWTNIGAIKQPADKGIMLSNIIEHGACESMIMSDKFSKRQEGRSCLVIHPKDKAVNLSALEYWKNGRQGDYIKCNENGEQAVFVDRDKSYSLTASYQNGVDPKQYFEQHGKQLVFIKQTPRGNNPGGIRAEDGKTPCLSSSSWQHNNHLTDGVKYRKLTVTECSRLQTVPEHHIDTLLNSGISKSQLYKMLGNGWTHDVITHIFKGLLSESSFIPETKNRMFKQMQLC